MSNYPPGFDESLLDGPENEYYDVIRFCSKCEKETSGSCLHWKRYASWQCDVCNYEWELTYEEHDGDEW